VSAPEQQTRTPGLALYRKYRSATFAEVVGQEHVTGPLMRRARRGPHQPRVPVQRPARLRQDVVGAHPGPLAELRAGPTPRRAACATRARAGPRRPGSIDVIEIDAASHGGVDDARELRERAFYAPVRDRFKVYIIDEAHMVSAQGFNALLKLVEEPPDFLVFVFATTEPDKVLQTIRSRTPPLSVPAAAAQRHAQAPRAHLRSRGCDGGAGGPATGGARRRRQRPRRAVDPRPAPSRRGPNGVTYADAVALLGVTDSGLLDDMVDALAAGDAKAVLRAVDRVVEAGHDPRRFAADLLERLRDLLLLDAVPDAATNGLLDLPADALARISEQSSRIGRASGVRYAEILHAALVEMRGTTAPRLVLELVCARMPPADASADSAALLQRLERLERRNELLDGGGPEPPPVAEPLPLGTAPAPQARARPALRSRSQRSRSRLRTTPARPEPRPPSTQPTCAASGLTSSTASSRSTEQLGLCWRQRRSRLWTAPR
jgi:DNA polymerase-3 subunit gamma/tau